jgi:hypothetical protein
VLPLEGNDRLSGSSKGRVQKKFLVNQQMSTFTPEIRIESAESASVPRCWSTSQISAGQIHRFFIRRIKLGKPDFFSLDVY